MLPRSTTSQLLRALWQRGHVSGHTSSLPASYTPFPFLRQSVFTRSTSLHSLTRRPPRSAICARCSRPVTHFIAAFTSSTSTTTSAAASAPHTTAPSSSAARTAPLPPPPPPSSPPPRPSRPPGSAADELRGRNSRLLKYVAAVAIFALAASYAAVPLYRIFCQHTGYGGTTQRKSTTASLASVAPSDRTIVITFTADTSPSLHWSFTPSQTRLTVRVGEPTLAFYRATNNRDKPVTGVATYNVTPMKTGLYFHKIQCFCFDEQRLRAHETVDMPVFFYIDPSINDDRRCGDVKHITLSYTFFPMKTDEEEEEEEEEERQRERSEVAVAQ